MGSSGRKSCADCLCWCAIQLARATASDAPSVFTVQADGFFGILKAPGQTQGSRVGYLKHFARLV